MSRTWKVGLGTCITFPFLHSNGKIEGGVGTPPPYILNWNNPIGIRLNVQNVLTNPNLCLKTKYKYFLQQFFQQENKILLCKKKYVFNFQNCSFIFSFRFSLYIFPALSMATAFKDGSFKFWMNSHIRLEGRVVFFHWKCML